MRDPLLFCYSISMAQKQKIAVLVSGGVDSSVALTLLKNAGHDVTAFYLKIWLEDELAYLGDCPWEEDLRYARAVTEKLGVPLRVVPLQKEYWERVVAATIDEVRSGRTPNPDVLCNARIKFGAFFEAVGAEFDRIATGHYARVEARSPSSSRARSRPGETATLDIPHSSSEASETVPARNISGAAKKTGELFEYVLKRSSDPVKDQTYFLSQLSRDQLKRALFPLGPYRKDQVRAMAKEFSLPNAERKDSQGICFLGKIPFNAFLRHHLGEKQGSLVEQETGKILGEHPGYWYFTIGQREGIRLPGGPWYVTRKDVGTNTVFISHARNREDEAVDYFAVRDLNWFNEAPEEGREYQVKLRHGPADILCQVRWQSNGALEVALKEKDSGVAAGQYAVFYDGEYCLGGGVIEKKIQSSRNNKGSKE